MVAGQIPVLHGMAAGQAPCNCMLWQVRPLFPPPATACYGGVTCMQHIACSCRLHDLHYSIDLVYLGAWSQIGWEGTIECNWERTWECARQCTWKRLRGVSVSLYIHCCICRFVSAAVYLTLLSAAVYPTLVSTAVYPTLLSAAVYPTLVSSAVYLPLGIQQCGSAAVSLPQCISHCIYICYCISSTVYLPLCLLYCWVWSSTKREIELFIIQKQLSTEPSNGRSMRLYTQEIWSMLEMVEWRPQWLLHVYLDRESQHHLMSCMRMKTCMKMVVVWGYTSGPGWCVSCQSIHVRIWEIVHIQASGPRDNHVNQKSQKHPE